MDRVSFYDIGGYRENVRRYKDGIEQLYDIQTMIKERVEIETNYSKYLQNYYDKWSNHVGALTASVLQAVWRDVLEESMELQKLHANVRDRMCEEILKTISLYLKENHHPSAFRASREMREIEDDFEKAQRSWRRQYEKVEKTKKAFHTAARCERSAQVQMKNASGDATITMEIESKYRDRYQKCQDELEKSEKSYRAALDDLNHLKKTYVSHMNDAFESCQQKELKRLKFVFEMISNLQKVLSDIASATKLNQLHHSLEKKLVTDNSRFNNDLDEWSKKYGPKCATKWPVFEPFTPLLNHITSRKKKKDGEVILMKQTFKDDESRSNSVYSMQSLYSQTTQSTVSTSTCPKTAIHNFGEGTENHANGMLSSIVTSTTAENSNEKSPVPTQPSSDHSSVITPSTVDPAQSISEAGQCINESLVSKDCMPYVAKVLHDYDAQDDDELSLKKGEQIDVLGGPDKLNWSLGMKDGRTGFFPAAFVQKI